MPKGSRPSSAYEISRSGRSTAQLRATYERVARAANKRLEKLKEAGFGQSEFVQHHKKGFKTDIMYDQYGRVRTKAQVSKMLAEVNRFMNSESSTVRGLKKARKELLDELHAVDEEGNPTRYEGITDENLDSFTRFMDEYHDRVEKQGQIGSNTAVQIFMLGERLRIKQESLIENMDNIDKYFEELEKMSVEDLTGVMKGNKRRFSYEDYRLAAKRQGLEID